MGRLGSLHAAWLGSGERGRAPKDAGAAEPFPVWLRAVCLQPGGPEASERALRPSQDHLGGLGTLRRRPRGDQASPTAVASPAPPQFPEVRCGPRRGGRT